MMCGSIIIARSVEYKSVFCWLDMHEKNTIEYVVKYLEGNQPSAAKRRAKCDSGVRSFTRVKE